MSTFTLSLRFESTVAQVELSCFFEGFDDFKLLSALDIHGRKRLYTEVQGLRPLGSTCDHHGGDTKLIIRKQPDSRGRGTFLRRTLQNGGEYELVIVDSRDEFVSLLSEAQRSSVEDAFRTMDRDGSGWIARQEAARYVDQLVRANNETFRQAVESAPEHQRIVLEERYEERIQGETAAWMSMLQIADADESAGVSFPEFLRFQAAVLMDSQNHAAVSKTCSVM